MPTRSCTTALELVSKLSQPPELAPLVLVPPLVTVEPFQVPTDDGARSNSIRKKIWYVFEFPQKPPPVTMPVTVWPLMLIEPLRLPVALLPTLTRTLAVVDDG